jgi:Protein of unknown function (DUF2971)
VGPKEFNVRSDLKYRGYNLPLPLEAAPQRFGEWSDAQLLREQDEVTPTIPLFHYTGREALEGILRNRYLWCFRHDEQDDEEEFQYSLGVARAELDRVTTHGEEFGKEFAACVTDLINQNVLTDRFNFYLFSVSQNRDSELQWKEYGHYSTGFSIGFAPKLFLPDKLTLSPVANENAHVGRVVYGDSKTSYRHRKVIERVAEITHQVAAKNRRLLRRESVHVDYINAMAKEYIARQLIWRCLTAKRSRWEHQSEVRFVVMNQPKNFDGLEKAHGGRRYITYALPLADPDSIAEIMIGSAAPGDAETWLQQLLNDLGYSGVPVTRSLKRTAA